MIGQDRHKRLTLLGLTVEARAQITNRLWRLMPPGVVYIGRPMPRVRLARSKWANPFKIGSARETESSPNIVLGFCGGRS